MPHYQNIKEIVSYYEEYEQSTQSCDLASFADWFAKKMQQKTAIPEENAPAFIKESSESWLLTAKIGAMQGQVSRFMKMLIKKGLEEFPLQSIEEFGLLSQIKEMKNPSKSEVAAYLFMEITTTSEIIKRLISAGLVTEFPDENDKRAKRLTLTNLGKEVQAKVTERMKEVGEMGFGRLSQTDKETLLKLLYELGAHHTHFYQHYKEKSWEELGKVMK